MKNNRAGVTLLEMIITVAVIGIAAMMCKIGVDIINGLARQRYRIETQRKAQDALYNIVKDIRNCKSIRLINPNKLILQEFNVSNLGTQGYDTKYNPNLFYDSSSGSVTYELKGAGEKTYLERKVSFPIMSDKTSALATNILADTTNYLFQPFSFDADLGTATTFDAYVDTSTCNGVTVRLTLSNAHYGGQNDREYTVQVMKKGALN